MTVNIPVAVPLKPSLRKRFYEALVLWDCLKKSFAKGKRTEVTERISDDEQVSGERQLYHCFVNKLAQICDIKKGSDTVTALGIVQPGETRYLFASNQRTEDDWEEVKAFVEDILNTLGEAKDEEVQDARANTRSTLFSEMLRKILRFNRPRLQHYIRVVAQEIETCIESVQESEDGDSAGAQEATVNLEKLVPLLRFVGSEALDKGKAKVGIAEFVDRTEQFLEALNGCYRSSLEDFIRQQSVRDRERQPGDSSWYNMHHATGRLMSYFYAVGNLLKARKNFPDLFSNFSVECIPSSEPGDTPDIRKNVTGIVSRLTTDKSIVEMFRMLEPQLQEWGLAESIKRATSPRAFQPRVHAELQVDDFIRREQRRAASTLDAEPLPYYREYEFGAYIGGSKPTCKLCSMYFAEHPDGVQVRPSHDNVYYNWRVPDVFESDPESVRAGRKAVLEAMVKGIRAAIVRDIRKQSAVRNRFDSNNTPSYPMGDVSVTTRMGALSVVDESVGASSRDTTPEDERLEQMRRGALKERAVMEGRKMEDKPRGGGGRGWKGRVIIVEDDEDGGVPL